MNLWQKIFLLCAFAGLLVWLSLQPSHKRDDVKSAIKESFNTITEKALYAGITWGWKMQQNGWTLEQTLAEFTNRWASTDSTNKIK